MHIIVVYAEVKMWTLCHAANIVVVVDVVFDFTTIFVCFRENDQDVGIGKMDDRVSSIVFRTKKKTRENIMLMFS